MDSVEQCVNHLRGLIAHRSVNPGGDEVGLATQLASTLKELGADSVDVGEVARPSTKGAYVYAQFGTPSLLLNAHLDTVPANSGWQRDPFVPDVADGRLYGLGSCDIKGAIAAILTALASGKARNLGVLFSGDEEAGSRCMPHFLANTDTAAIKTAIVCEPTARCAGIRHRGVLAYNARYVGKGGHSSKADTMEKPIVELAKLALGLDAIALERLTEGPEGMKGLCMNVAKLTGGVAYNVVPDLGELSFSLRPPPGFDAEEFNGVLENARKAAHSKIELSCITDHKPFACGAVDRIKELVGDYASEFVGLDFWTEAALLQEAGIDSVVIGPGDIQQAHTADEFVLLEDLAWATHMFEDLIERHAA
jgi:acetylornithine deacetylase